MVRCHAIYAVVLAFLNVPDKEQAWADLHVLVENEEDFMRFKIANELISVLNYMPDKKQAWDGLLQLDQYWDDSHVRGGLIYALSQNFPHLHNKEQACGLRPFLSIKVKTRIEDKHLHAPARDSPVFKTESVTATMLALTLPEAIGQPELSLKNQKSGT